MAAQMEVDAGTSTQNEQEPVFFFVKGLNGKSFSMEAEPSQTIQSVVSNLVKKGIAPTADLVILLGRHQLSLDSTVQQSGIRRDCTVQLLGRLRSSQCPGVWTFVETITKLHQHVQHLPAAPSSPAVGTLLQLCSSASYQLDDMFRSPWRSSQEFSSAAVDAALLMQQVLDAPQCPAEVCRSCMDWLGSLFQNMLMMAAGAQEPQHGTTAEQAQLVCRSDMHAAMSVTLIAVSCAREHGHSYDSWMNKLQLALASYTSTLGSGLHAGMIYDQLRTLCLHEAGHAKRQLVRLHVLLEQGGDSTLHADLNPSALLQHLHNATMLARTAATVTKGLQHQPSRFVAGNALLVTAEKMCCTLVNCMDLAHKCAQMCLRLRLGWAQRPPTPTYMNFVPELLADINGLCTIMQTVAAMEDAAYLAKSPAWVGYTLRVLQHPLFTSMLGCQSNKFAKQLFQAGAPLWALQQLSPDVANGLPPTLGMTFLRELAFPKRDGWHENAEDGPVITARRTPPHILVEDSFDAVMSLDAALLRLAPSFSFIGEEGSGPGVYKEWLTLLSQSLFDPSLALFSRCCEDTAALHPCSGASIQTGWKEYMRFAGRITGLALRHRFTLGVRFSSAFCKMLRCCQRPADGKQGVAGVELAIASKAAALGWGVTMDDLKEVDAETHHSCMALLATQNVECLCLTFTTDSGKLCGGGDAELVKGGADKPVTDANKHEFVQGKINFQLWDACREQVRCFYYGLSEVAEPTYSREPLLLPLTATELNDLLGGAVGAPDVADWRAATDPSSGFAPDAPVLRWFWQAVTDMDAAQRRKLLRFWTGISALPAGGFARLEHRLEIARAAVTGAVLPLPTAHTCFRQLVLAEGYQCADELQQALHLALEHMEAFTMV